MKEMKAIIGVTAARKLYETEHIFGIDDNRRFLINMFGKYQPNMSFIVPVEHYVDRNGKAVSFLEYKEANVTLIDALAVDFNGNGSPEVLFGDFWRSKKGGACFRPKSPKQAQHVLVRVNWGGAFSKCRGQYDKEDGGGLSYLAQYFRRAKSNGGGVGYDYYVFPMDMFGPKTQAAIREERAAARETCLLNEAEARQARTAAEEDATLNADERWSRIEKVQKQAEEAGIHEPSISNLRRDGIYVVNCIRKRILTEEYVSEVENTLSNLIREKKFHEECIAFFMEQVSPWLKELGFYAELRRGETELEVFYSSGDLAFNFRFKLNRPGVNDLVESVAYRRFVEQGREKGISDLHSDWKEYKERTRSDWPVWPFED